ncbi:hypothetical protein L596_026223 [Steinernema carpocapsae]|uniref:Uncharacterized protein n=1 Tax=Steinernema carpocapsae TaxID=34508 RepID=A0A4V5ZYC3_STECR|nr:hypothetical protein L596_026223 [Steinernema carpocapsae]
MYQVGVGFFVVRTQSKVCGSLELNIQKPAVTARFRQFLPTEYPEVQHGRKLSPFIALFAVFVILLADSASNAPFSNDGNAVDQLLQNLGLGNATPGVNTTLGGLGTPSTASPPSSG